MRTRILFVSEAVTLAQVVRLHTLAQALDPRRFDVHFAASHFEDFIFAQAPWRRWPIHSLSSAVVDARVAAGQRIYDIATLERYVADDLAVIDAVRPALVVGDLRWSLAVAAPRAGVPLASLINAYWSPRAYPRRLPLPDHPLVRRLGPTLAGLFFPLALPFVFRSFAAPLNALRRRHRLPTLGSLRELLTFGDYTLFPDVPTLVPVAPLQPSERYLGPVLWSPAGAAPASWDRLDRGRPTVYLTLGSSGRTELLPLLMRAVAAAGAQAIVATAGRASEAIDRPPEGAVVSTFVPGGAAVERAQLVISNGGSTTGYQALAGGRPVVGVASNLDQHLATAAIVRAGAGLCLRSDTLTLKRAHTAVRRLLDEASFSQRARDIAAEFTRWNAAERFRAFVDEVVA